ncbi:MAG: PQQ-binding-like beta-propeller repeat protein [Phycisphaerae bacterium]|jgi:outer membrane protein assembly factor BamB|nr:PQQ-binding-like beta-propeller repeat protein [Phycisphaerae bacterium]
MKTRPHFAVSVLLLVTTASAIAGKNDWSQWRGKDGRGISSETGLLQTWPEGGPKKLWETSAIGKGFSSPIIVDGAIYITGNIKKELMVFALNLDGSIKWKRPNGRAWKMSYPGSRASCSYSDGKLHNVGSFGRLLCMEAKSGKEIWSVDLVKKYKCRGEAWGLHDVVVIDGRTVYAAITGADALVAALDKNTGKEIWRTKNTIDDYYTYSSPILADVDGRKQVICCGGVYTYGVDAKTGKLLWKFPHVYRGRMIATMPTFADGAVFVTNCHPNEGITYRLDFKEGKARKTWQADLGGDGSGGIIIRNGVIYGSRHHYRKGFVSLNAKTGKVMAHMKLSREAAVLYADSRLYCQDSIGTISLLEARRDAFVVRGKLFIAKAKNFLAHPVISAGKLYLRYDKTLYCYDIKK